MKNFTNHLEKNCETKKPSVKVSQYFTNCTIVSQIISHKKYTPCETVFFSFFLAKYMVENPLVSRFTKSTQLNSHTLGKYIYNLFYIFCKLPNIIQEIYTRIIDK